MKYNQFKIHFEAFYWKIWLLYMGFCCAPCVAPEGALCEVSSNTRSREVTGRMFITLNANSVQPMVKKCTPCQGVVWFSPSKCHIFYTGFSVVLYLHNWSPLKPQNKLQKKSRALPSSSRRGLRAPDPANPSSEKMTSQPTCFCCAYFPKRVTNLHRLFNMSCINTHFDMFFKN